MKRATWILIGALIVSGTAMATSIDGSKHDLGTYDNGSSARICIFCHYPHNAVTTLQAPLWNHADSTDNTSYTMYDGGASSTLDATVDAMQWDSGTISNLCLSCHDGTVALASVLKGGLTNTTKMTGDALVSTDLSNDHPINFNYDSALTALDNELKDPEGAAISALLYNNKVQCSSCHDVHDNQYGKFLVATNNNSALCLTCHDK